MNVATKSQVQRKRNRPTLKIPISLSLTFDYCTQFPRNSQLTVTDFEHLYVETCLLSTLITMSSLFSIGLAPLLLRHDLSD